MIQVSKNVYVETGMTACNVGFVITKAGVVMIDTPMRPNDAIKWRDAAAGERKNRIRHQYRRACGSLADQLFFPGCAHHVPGNTR